MDFFDTDAIEGKEDIQATESTLQQLIDSKKIDHKLKALAYLKEGKATDHWPIVLKMATYSIKSVSEPAMVILLRTLRNKKADSAEDGQTLEVLIKNVIPWHSDRYGVGQAAQQLVEQQGQIDEKALEGQELWGLVEGAIEYCVKWLSNAELNRIILASFSRTNYLAQLAVCRVVKHILLNVEDKSILDMNPLVDTLVSVGLTGIRDVKKLSTICLSAYYKAFGDKALPNLSKLSSQEKVNEVITGADLLVLKAYPKKPPVPSSNKKVIGRSVIELKSNKKEESMAIAKSRIEIPSNKHTEKVTESTVKRKSIIQDQKTIQNIKTVQEIEQGKGVGTLLMDDKWAKKVQTNKSDDITLRDLDSLMGYIRQYERLALLPSQGNKPFFLALRNLLKDPNQHICSQALRCIQQIVEKTRGEFTWGFSLFFDDVACFVRGKDKGILECAIQVLVDLVESTPLSPFLKKVVKHLQENNSILRFNLLQVLHKVFGGDVPSQQQGYEGNKEELCALFLQLKNDISRDVSVSVRNSCENFLNVFQSFYPSLEQQAEERHPMAPRPTDRVSVSKNGSAFAKEKSVVDIASNDIFHFKNSIIPARRNSNAMLSSTMNSSTGKSRLSECRTEQKQKKQDEGSSHLQPVNESSFAFGKRRLSHTQYVASELQSVEKEIESLDFESMLNYAESALQDKHSAARARIGDILVKVAGKSSQPHDFEALLGIVDPVKLELEPLAMFKVFQALHERTRYFPSTFLANYMPLLLCTSEVDESLKRNQLMSSMTNKKISTSLLQVSTTQSRQQQLMTDLVRYYGPISFFDIFEDAMYRKELFGSASAEYILTLFESLLIGIPEEYHPVVQILSIVRGFIYLHASQTVKNRLGELVNVLSRVYGKKYGMYLRKEFEVLSIQEVVVETCNWPPIEGFDQTHELQILAKTDFKDKILSTAADLSSTFRGLLHTGDELSTYKSILQVCLRNFIYIIKERENTELLGFLLARVGEANLLISRLCMQALALHVSSAKCPAFKYNQVLLQSFLTILQSKNAEIKAMAKFTFLSIIKQDIRLLKTVIQEREDNTDDMRLDLSELIIKIFTKDSKSVAGYDLNQGFQLLINLLSSKRRELRNNGLTLLQQLSTFYEKKDFLSQLKSQRQGVVSTVGPLLDEVYARKKGEAGNGQVEARQGAGEAGKFVVRRLQELEADIVKCKEIKGFLPYAEKHLARDLMDMLFDINTARVYEGLRTLELGLFESPDKTVKALVFIIKLLNLLIQGETKPNKNSEKMAQIVSEAITMKKNSLSALTKEEKWSLMEFLSVLFKAKFDKKVVQGFCKQCLELMSREEGYRFLCQLQKCDPRLFKEVLQGMKVCKDICMEFDGRSMAFPPNHEESMADRSKIYSPSEISKVEEANNEINESKDDVGIMLNHFEAKKPNELTGGEKSPKQAVQEQEEKPQQSTQEVVEEIKRGSTGDQSRYSYRQQEKAESGKEGLRVESLEDVVQVFEKGLTQAMPEAVLYLREEQEGLYEKELQVLLPLVNNYMGAEGASERLCASLVDVLCQVVGRVDLQMMVNTFRQKSEVSSKTWSKMCQLRTKLIQGGIAEDLYISCLEGSEPPPEECYASLMEEVMSLGLVGQEQISTNFIETVRSFYNNEYNVPHLQRLEEYLRTSRQISLAEEGGREQEGIGFSALEDAEIELEDEEDGEEVL